MFAACIGYQKGMRKELPSGKKTTIRMKVFGENDIALLKSIAIAETEDVVVLGNMEERC